MKTHSGIEPTSPTRDVVVMDTKPQGFRCDCCWNMYDLEDIGTLRMPLRRPFRVCKECVNFMWHGRHPEVGE